MFHFKFYLSFIHNGMHWFFFTLFKPNITDDERYSIVILRRPNVGWGRCVLIFRKNVMSIVFGWNTFLCYVSCRPWFFHAIFHHCSRVEAMLKAWGRDQDCWANDEVRLFFWIVTPCGTCPLYLCLFCFTFEQAFAHLRLIEPKETCLAHLCTEQYHLAAVSDICFCVCPLDQVSVLLGSSWNVLPFQIKLYCPNRKI